jgi:hypothetical protein
MVLYTAAITDLQVRTNKLTTGMRLRVKLGFVAERNMYSGTQ